MRQNRLANVKLRWWKLVITVFYLWRSAMIAHHPRPGIQIFNCNKYSILSHLDASKGNDWHWWKNQWNVINDYSPVAIGCSSYWWHHQRPFGVCKAGDSYGTDKVEEEDVGFRRKAVDQATTPPLPQIFLVMSRNLSTRMFRTIQSLTPTSWCL
jgi:hypothetical protein